MLRDAVAVQDALKYDEPQDWFFPVRESLGGALLMSGDAKGAEQVFRDDLARNLRNPRSLFGLHRALKAQDRNSDAWFVEQELRKAVEGRSRRIESGGSGVGGLGVGGLFVGSQDLLVCPNQKTLSS